MFAGTEAVAATATPLTIKKAELDIARYGIYLSMGSLILGVLSFMRKGKG